MSALTGNQIKDTYQGLLKLADSSTGITNSLQAIQDGLGNDTGLRIATDQLEAANIPTFIALKAPYYGPGFLASAPQQYAAGTQNVIISSPFYDGGEYAYTAMTYNIITATTSSDVVTGAFYTAQMSPTGLIPHTPILSGITINTSPVGLNTTTFGSDLSFSGYGGGVFFFVYQISNAGVQPTIRFGQTTAAGALNQAGAILGVAKQAGQNAYQQPWSLNGTQMVFSGQTTFDNPFANSLGTLQSSTQTIQGAAPGFILHTKDA